MRKIFAIGVVALVLGGTSAALAANREISEIQARPFDSRHDIQYRPVVVVSGALMVAKTGQTECWDDAGVPIDCRKTGHDGEYQMGVSVEPRFTDNGDGTVTDNLTGLIWLQDANCFGLRNWMSALSDANTLASGTDTCAPDLTDGSLAGDWRLPNIRELQSLIDYSQSFPALPPDHPFSGVQSSNYWSSTSFVNNLSSAKIVGLAAASVGQVPKDSIYYYVWPVRGGESVSRIRIPRPIDPVITGP